MEDYPRVIKGYTFVQFCDRGSYGAVCKYQKNNEYVAIKLESTQNQIQSITSEAINLRKMNQIAENIPQFERLFPRYIDHGLTTDPNDNKKSSNFLIMEYLDQSLNEYVKNLREAKKLNLGQISKQILNCVKNIHAVGFISKDIKPDNFRVKNNQVYIIDFGISREYKDSQSGQHIPDASGK